MKPFGVQFDFSPEAFSVACCHMLTTDRTQNGIGTLGEKTLHATVKLYISPNTSTHEIKCKQYVADILTGNDIFEIQTRGFEHLRGKLGAFLPDYHVTVVYPIPQIKWVSKLNRNTGECSPKRKSPKKGSAFDVFKELYRIRPYLSHPHFALRLLFMEVTDYRIVSGNGKERGQKFERMPSALLNDITLSLPKDYLSLLPKTLPALFTSRDLAQEAHIPAETAQQALLILKDMGVVSHIGKSGRFFLYQINTNI